MDKRRLISTIKSDSPCVPLSLRTILGIPALENIPTRDSAVTVPTFTSGTDSVKRVVQSIRIKIYL